VKPPHIVFRGRFSGDARKPPLFGAAWARVLTRTRTQRVACAHDTSIVRRAAGRFGAVGVGAAPTCALIANGAPAIYLVLGAQK
jgi:hypothetical protein